MKWKKRGKQQRIERKERKKGQYIKRGEKKKENRRKEAKDEKWHKEYRNVSFYKNMYVFISLESGQSFCCVRETESNGDVERRRQTAILTYNFVVTAGWYLSGAPRHSLALSVTNRISSGRTLRLTQYWTYLTWVSEYIISQSPTHFHSITWLLPRIETGTSCAEKYLIDSSANDQYATLSL